MKKLIFLLCIVLQVSFLYSGGWQKIYDSGNFGIGKLNAFRTAYGTQKSIFIQKGCYVIGGGPPYWCSVVAGSDDYLRLNKSNNTMYIPYGQFLKSSYCVFTIGGNPACWCEALDFFTVSGRDSMLALKYYNYYCYMGGSFIKTTITYNGGTNTTDIFNGSQVNGCVINSLNDSIIVIGVNGTIYKSTNRGSNWNQTCSVNLKTIESGGFLTQDPYRSSNIYAAGSSSMYLSSNYGNDFSVINVPPFMFIAFGQKGNVNGVDSFNLYKSTDFGISWTNIFHNLRPRAFEVSPDNSEIMYLGNNEGLYKSTNGGINWVLYNNSFWPSYKVIGISKDPNTFDSVYVATTDALYKVWAGDIVDTNIVPDSPVLISPPNGTIGLLPEVTLKWKKTPRATSYNVQVCLDTTFPSWNLVYNLTLTDTSAGLSNLYPLRKYYWRVKAINHGGSSAYSAVWNFKIQGGPMYVGQISPLNNSVDVPVPTALICNRAEIETYLKAGKMRGISTDSLPITYVFDIVLDTITLNGEVVRYLNDTIDIETELSGLTKYYWRVRAYNFFGGSQFGSWWNFTTMLIGIKVLSTESPTEFALYTNYPNPFNPITKIRFDIPPLKGARGMTARLVIYDALGREVTALVNEQLSPGAYEAEWDASSYPSGVYFYKLTAGDYAETKKMVLLK